MSVLNFPRLYMNGHMFWNPPTGNNNDVFPLYDAVKMQLNWPFLEHYSITPENAPKTVNPWLITPIDIENVPDYVLQVPTNASSSTYPFMPAEWDLFGDNGCGTVDFNGFQSKIIGGELQANSYIDSDSVVNKKYQLLGNPFGSDKPTPARFVDVSPWENTFTAMYFDKLAIGDESCGITLNRKYRMLDRFLNFNWGALSQFLPEYSGLSFVTTTWQTCFPKENIEWAIGDSQLLAQLQTQMDAQKAQGLMYRFSTYLTFYDQNGIFNDYPVVNSHSKDPKDVAHMQQMYEKGLENVADIFFNPAYSCTAGTLGLWFENEYPTAPGGRRLVPVAQVPLSQSADTEPSADSKITSSLGVICAEVHGDTLSLDLSNSFPFYPEASPVPGSPNINYHVPQKYNAGSYELGVSSEGKFTPVTTLDYSQYQQESFDLRSGIVDISLTQEQKLTLQKGEMELRLSGDSSSKPISASKQQMWTVEVVESASFIDVGDKVTLNIMVQYDGLPAPEGTVLWVAEYGNAYIVTTSHYYLTFTNNADFTLFENCPTDYSNNQPVLPQFNDSKALTTPVFEGSGRNLAGVDIQPDNTVLEPVSYQSFVDKPSAENLSPCLQFSTPIDMSGTLATPSQDKGTVVNYEAAKITTDANGIAQLTFDAIAPGFPALRFFVQEDNQAPRIPFSFKYTKAYVDFMAPIRVLPKEPELEQDFVTYWNSIYQDQDAAQKVWENFIFAKILRPFYYLYPIMDKYMPLDSLSRVEGAIDQLIVLVSKEYQDESTLAMPITRDLPQSRRAVLELWAQKLVKRNYPPIPLDIGDFDNL